MKIQDALEIEFDSRDLNERLTIKSYFKRLLKTLWHEDEGYKKTTDGGKTWIGSNEQEWVNAKHHHFFRTIKP